MLCFRVVPLACSSLLALAACCRGSEHALEDLWASADVTVTDDERWRGASRARLLSSTFGAKETAVRSVLVIDGTNEWHSLSGRLHREALYESRQLMEMHAATDLPPNAYAFAHEERRNGLLDTFRKDPSVQEALARIFGVDALGCRHGRARGSEVFLIAQNATMTPDAFHSDICDDTVAGHRGITVLTYPHDVWEARWRGHFELGSEAAGPLAGVAPLPDRSVVFDACVEHRATNPAAASEPVRGEAYISYAFRREVGVGERRWWQLLPRFDFRGWRFAVSMQLRCPETRVADDATRPRGEGKAARGSADL